MLALISNSTKIQISKRFRIIISNQKQSLTVSLTLILLFNISIKIMFIDEIMILRNNQFLSIEDLIDNIIVQILIHNNK